MTVSELIYRMSTLPAKILGRDLGTLRVGAPADLILIDEHETWVVDPERLHGKSKNAVFKGRKLQSKIKMTVYNGEIVFEDEREKDYGV
jgi:dihydroorotase